MLAQALAQAQIFDPNTYSGWAQAPLIIYVLATVVLLVVAFSRDWVYTRGRYRDAVSYYERQEKETRDFCDRLFDQLEAEKRLNEELTKDLTRLTEEGSRVLRDIAIARLAEARNDRSG